MISLKEFLAKNKSNSSSGSGNVESDIFTLARYIEAYVNDQWLVVFENDRARLLELFSQYGDGATYGRYGTLLFKPVNQQLKQVGVDLTPGLPGDFRISREWGPEEERQRWFWSKLSSEEGIDLGTIVVIFYHDHTEARIPEPAQIFALEETSQEAVIQALATRSKDFKKNF